MSSSQKVFTVTASVGPDSGMQEFTLVDVAGSLRAAHAIALTRMVNWVEGMWHNYSDRSVAKLRAAIEESDFETAIDLWNDMTSLQIKVEEKTVVTDEALPNLDWEESESDVSSSSSSSSEESDY